MKEKFVMTTNPDYAETVELCFVHGPKKFRKFATISKFLVNTCICLVQLGYCSVYFVFAGRTLKAVCKKYSGQMERMRK